MQTDTMRIVNYSDARASLKAVLDRVAADADVTVINRRDGEDAVVMSLEHYNSLIETMHLLRSPANARRLAESIEQAQRGIITKQGLIDEKGLNVD